MLIYISGPLQGASHLDAARGLYEDLAGIVRDCGHEAYLPHHHTDPMMAGELSALDVFATDVAALNSANAVIAHIGLPSTGVGAELALAAASNRRILGLRGRGERGSRFAEGLIIDAGGSVVKFVDRTDLRSQISRWLDMPSSWFGHPQNIHRSHQVVA